MIASLAKKRVPTVLLGLALDGARLHGVLLRRSNGSLQIGKVFSADLALSPGTADPELVGREIRNHLEQAGIRERRCAVCLPLNWALAVRSELPELPESDVASFLEIEAERGFPYGPDLLSTVLSRYRSASGQGFATQVAISRSHLAQLERCFKAAQLRPVSFTLGICALQPLAAGETQGVMALLIGERSVDLQITCGGGVVALRGLENVFDAEGVPQRLVPDLLVREIRITLGQLPEAFAGAVRTVRVFGRGESVKRFVAEAAGKLRLMGLEIEWVETYPPGAFPRTLPPGIEVSAALSIAARCVSGLRSAMEFLPARRSSWQRWTTRFSSRKLVWAGGVAAVAVGLAGGAFLYQQWQLSRLGAQWERMEARVREVESMQQQIKRFRPWFDESIRSLTILRQVTEAFPEDGVVSAKTLEIRDVSMVTCSGVARDNQALLKMLDQLRAAKEVGDLKVDQIRGKTPLQFTINFHWGEGGGDVR